MRHLPLDPLATLHQFFQLDAVNRDGLNTDPGRFRALLMAPPESTGRERLALAQARRGKLFARCRAHLPRQLVGAPTCSGLATVLLEAP
jgi:hypothetical protein